MKKTRIAARLLMLSCLIALMLSMGTSMSFALDLTPKQELGKYLFFDADLSTPKGQSCASCHSPLAGFADPDQNLPVSQGVLPQLYGNRNTPTSAYAAFSPNFHFDAAKQEYVGGQFWDGRALNLVEQAKGPFLNPLEMHNPNKVVVVNKVRKAKYADLFTDVYGDDAFANPEAAYDKIAAAIAAYESTAEMNPFTSKFDYFLAGKAKLSMMEMMGLQVFRGKGKCETCHPSMPGPNGQPPLFTNFTYVNIGAPKNFESPFLYLPIAFNPDGINYIDLGLGGFLKDSKYSGMFKVPTLRNVTKTAPYGHNGYFKTLMPMTPGGGMGGGQGDGSGCNCEGGGMGGGGMTPDPNMMPVERIYSIIHFYNMRDMDPLIPEPEVPANVNTADMGNLGLTMQEAMSLTRFLETLTDGYQPGQGGGGGGCNCGGGMGGGGIGGNN